MSHRRTALERHSPSMRSDARLWRRRSDQRSPQLVSCQAAQGRERAKFQASGLVRVALVPEALGPAQEARVRVGRARRPSEPSRARAQPSTQRRTAPFVRQWSRECSPSGVDLGLLNHRLCQRRIERSLKRVHIRLDDDRVRVIECGLDCRNQYGLFNLSGHGAKPAGRQLATLSKSTGRICDWWCTKRSCGWCHTAARRCRSHHSATRHRHRC